MNMSLGGGKSAAVNSAINQIRAAGVLPIVAAGNDNVDGKPMTSSPDSEPRLPNNTEALMTDPWTFHAI